MKKQRIFNASQGYDQIADWLREKKIQKFLLVCGSSIRFLNIGKYFEHMEKNKELQLIRFNDFSPNPEYVSVVKAVELFRKEGCEAIVAVGGGSAIDVAKCVKLFCNMDGRKNYLKQMVVPNEVEFLAIPTTAGTGSETTRFAAIYDGGKKETVSHEECIPSAVFFDSSALSSLPLYHKKSTAMDALSHAIESFWSVNSTETSRKYSKEATEMVLGYLEGYLANDVFASEKMLCAANIAGKAIDIAQTTAGHAMCYKMTSMYGIAHGHAAILCNRKLFPWMAKNTDKCVDLRGEGHVKTILREISAAMGCSQTEEATKKLDKLFQLLALPVPNACEKDYKILAASVNPVRMKNHPIYLDDNAINSLYREILSK